MLSEKINEPLPQFELGLSQPEKQKLKSFIASEPIMTNPKVPTPSPVEHEDPMTSSPIKTIPDSLPVSVIPDSLKLVDSTGDDIDWQLQSSFDYNSKINDSELSVGEDTMNDFVNDFPVKEESSPKNEKKCVEDLKKTNLVTKPSLDVSNLASASSTKNSKKKKKPLKFEDCEPAAAVILVGTDNKKGPVTAQIVETIKIQNNFDRQMLSKRSDKEDNIEVLNVIKAMDDPIIEIEDPRTEIEMEFSEGDQIGVEVLESNSEGNSPDLSQELEQINQDISMKAPSSPGDVYKTMLKDGLKESCKEALSAKNSPAQKKLQGAFKRRLMDTDENYLCSQNSQESPTPSQVKKLPAFARKRELPSINTSSNFVISRNQTLNQTRTREKSDETFAEEIIPVPPARRSILKKKFLIKNTGPSTPKLGKFDFDEKSPAKSDASWVKTDKKKKRTAGFKTKKQKLEEERDAKRKLKEGKKKEQPNKVYKLFLVKISNNVYYVFLCKFV